MARVRLLHIVENLHTGTVENWLARMFSAARSAHPEVEWTFYCALGRPGRLDDRVRALGGEIIYSPVWLAQKWQFMRSLRQAVCKGGFDIVHCHHDFVNSIYLAALVGIPLRQRISHVHNTDEDVLTPNRLKQAILREPMRRLTIALSDQVIGISRHTLSVFLRGRPPRPQRDRLHYYGVDTTPFRKPLPPRNQLRVLLGLPVGGRILLFTGRMAPLKNPCYAVEVLAELTRMRKDVYAVFAGAGPLESEVRRLAAALGVGERVRVLGWRDDTAELMCAADLLIWPRLEEPKEGLGLVIVEAQAAGLPVLMSPSLPEDAIVMPELFETLPLSAGPVTWAAAACRMLDRQYPDAAQALAAVESSPFGMKYALQDLMALYGLDGAARVPAPERGAVQR